MHGHRLIVRISAERARQLAAEIDAAQDYFERSAITRRRAEELGVRPPELRQALSPFRRPSPRLVVVDDGAPAETPLTALLRQLADVYERGDTPDLLAAAFAEPTASENRPS